MKSNWDFIQPKLSNIVNFSDSIGKITSKSIRFLFKKRFEVHKKIDYFLVKIMKNSGKSATSAIMQFLSDDPKNR